MFAFILQFVFARILYFALHMETGSFPKPLNAKEEQQAFEALEAGDMQAREKLISHNLRLVAHIVKKYYAADCDQEDLISIGTIGLIKAVSSFRQANGARFSTFAARCIENEILMYFRSMKKTKGTVSLYDAIDSDKDGNALVLGDIVADEADVGKNYENKEEQSRLMCAVRGLDERDKKIIVLRYGLAGQPPCTQQQVELRMGISRSYVSRIEKHVLSLLRTEMREGKK